MKNLIKILIVVIIGVATNVMGFPTVPLTTIITQTADNLKTAKMENEIEIWKDIEGYEGYYQISNNGNAKSLERIVHAGRGDYLKKEHIISPNKSTKGYLAICMCVFGKVKYISLHRTVAIAFIANPDNLPEINHKDGDKENCCDWNLEWCTSSENKYHAYKTGLRLPPNLGRIGSNNKRSKKIMQFDLNGKFISTYCSSINAMEVTGIDNSRIGRCAKGIYHTAGGFIWKYAV